MFIKKSLRKRGGQSLILIYNLRGDQRLLHMAESAWHTNLLTERIILLGRNKSVCNLISLVVRNVKIQI